MQNNKTFRLFISSTFNDFRGERKALQKEVFPKIKDYCSDKGLTFQPIDLRWGVTEEAQLDQKTLELCLEEVRACKNHPAPNFLLMLGDRYGWVALPYHIKKEEFDSLFILATREQQTNLNRWYQLDENQIPASYCLAERKGDFKVYEAWGKEEVELRGILQSLVNQSDLNDSDKKKYFQSATEAEIVEGFKRFKLNGPGVGCTDSQVIDDQEDVFGFIRQIDKNTKQSDQFIPDANDEHQQAIELQSRVRSALKNIHEAKTVQTTEDSLAPDYLKEFKEAVTQFLKQRIYAQLKSFETIPPLELEIQAHKDFANTKTQSFIGQDDILSQIKSYCNDGSNSPLVIYGRSGLGKSAIMAKAYQQAHPNALVRFVGATPGSGDMKSILYSIFDQLGIEPRNPGGDSGEKSYNQFCIRMHGLILSLASLDRKIVVFLDAVDQLSHDDQFIWLPEKLPSNVKIIISALKDESFAEDSKYFESLSTKLPETHIIAVQSFDVNHAEELVVRMLKAENRTLQSHQMAYVLKQFKTSPTPLYLYIAAQEIKNWKSSDLVEEQTQTNEDQTIQDLQPTQKGIIQEYINNLSDFYHHDSRLVTRVLSYLYASENGLSESELLQLINQGKEFIHQIATEEFHKNETGELPIVIWARLYQLIKPFIKHSTIDGAEVISLFHREFENVIKQNPAQRTEREAIILATENLIRSYQGESIESSRWGELFSTLITQYHFSYQDQQQILADFIATLINDHYLYFTEITIVADTLPRVSLAFSKLKLIHEITKGLLESSPQQWVLARNHTTSLDKLAAAYGYLGEPKVKLELIKTSLDVASHWYELDLRWAGFYANKLGNLASAYFTLWEYKKSCDLFKNYFHVQVFSEVIDISYFIVPFVKYYQSALYINEKIDLSSLDDLAKRLIKLYKEKLGGDYDLKVEEAHQAYRSLLESNDSIDKETYEIFVKFFLVDQMKGI